MKKIIVMMGAVVALGLSGSMQAADDYQCMLDDDYQCMLDEKNTLIVEFRKNILAKRKQLQVVANKMDQGFWGNFTSEYKDLKAAVDVALQKGLDSKLIEKVNGIAPKQGTAAAQRHVNAADERIKILDKRFKVIEEAERTVFTCVAFYLIKQELPKIPFEQQNGSYQTLALKTTVSDADTVKSLMTTFALVSRESAERLKQDHPDLFDRCDINLLLENDQLQKDVKAAGQLKRDMVYKLENSKSSKAADMKTQVEAINAGQMGALKQLQDIQNSPEYADALIDDAIKLQQEKNKQTLEETNIAIATCKTNVADIAAELEKEIKAIEKDANQEMKKLFASMITYTKEIANQDALDHSGEVVPGNADAVTDTEVEKAKAHLKTLQTVHECITQYRTVVAVNAALLTIQKSLLTVSDDVKTKPEYCALMQKQVAAEKDTIESLNAELDKVTALVTDARKKAELAETQRKLAEKAAQQKGAQAQQKPEVQEKEGESMLTVSNVCIATVITGLLVATVYNIKKKYFDTQDPRKSDRLSGEGQKQKKRKPSFFEKIYAMIFS